ncbi:chemotaxis protein CheC [Brevibacillus sp. 7WMA2]|uniref:CheY-P phosphatase CheC n=1 Tax=Brevibacillus laterosporus LMG 15441 TaxID=1042163 RepID=A0A075R4X3_BRELA|nr:MULTISPECIES: chemotaxis protein CheC [Brevibacillus]AIG27592.1 CheY-P phosphatase CheC [Brevibacillus laterosporus LMG 15441]AUM65875.1 chemotaxis protein CheC [Brevibacillus laterosporus]AYK08951.1 chemotaxis protein CheC [Brevibacillus laterosporus]ERM19510.1 chemotaxis protein CheY [Brevibacillus laterosporus PE36]MBA4532308.1 chemotaxis protein CheC [Brevibacillus halotolerans]
MTHIKKLGEFQLDVLREVGNIGAGHATTALSQLIQKEIDMTVPQVKIISFQEIADFLGGDEVVVIAVFLRVEGDCPGNMFFIIDIPSAKNLLQHLLGIVPQEEQEEIFSEMELSALHEIGNIMAGSYLSSLADFTKLNMQPTVPALAIDMAGALLSYGLIELGRAGDFALTIDTAFMEGNEKMQGHFFLIPDPDSFATLFQALGVPLDGNY